MVAWKIWDESLPAGEWDNYLTRASDAHPLQCHFWGEYRRLAGWVPLRYIARDKNDAIAGMAQVLVKKYWGVHLVWIAGTVAMKFPGMDWMGLRQEMMESLVAELKSAGKLTYIRFNFLIPHDHGYSFELGHFCSRSLIRLSGGYSTIIDLEQIHEDLLKSFSSKHRYYVKKSLKQGITWRSGNDQELSSHIASLLHEIVATKKVSAIHLAKEEIDAICRMGGKNAFVLVGYLGEQPITACLSLIAGNHAFYQIAATGEQGRQLGAAYAMICHLLPRLKELGVKYFDFGGLNPADKNASGVSHFKRGFGGDLVEYLGEWECASSEWLRWAINLGIWKRGGRL